MMFFKAFATSFFSLITVPLFALSEETQQSLQIMQEAISLSIERGELDKDKVLPLLVEEITPKYEVSKDTFEPEVLNSLKLAFNSQAIVLCRTCRQSSFIDSSKQSQFLMPNSMNLKELVENKDIQKKEKSSPRSVVTIKETVMGVSIRLVSLSSGEVLLARNISPNFITQDRTNNTFKMIEDRERQYRGESLTHNVWDFAVQFGMPDKDSSSDLPVPNGGHISLDWVEQWGEGNRLLTGLSLSAWNPVLGIGASQSMALPQFHNSLIGGKVLLSLPRLLLDSLPDEAENKDTKKADENIDKLGGRFTFIAFYRLPFGSGVNYALFSYLGLSVGGGDDLDHFSWGVGISGLNASLIPFIP